MAASSNLGMFDNMTVLFVASLVAVFFLSFSITANDCAQTLGPAIGSGGLPMKAGLLIAATLAAVLALLAAPFGPRWVMSGLFLTTGFSSGSSALYAILASLMATACMALILTLLRVVTPFIIVLGGAFGGVALSQGAFQAQFGGVFLWMYGAVVMSVIAAAAIAAFTFWIVQHLVHFSDRLRARARRCLVAAAAFSGLLIPIAAVSWVVGGDWFAPSANNAQDFWMFGLLAGVILAIVAAMGHALWLRRNPVWPDDTIAGAETAFWKLQNALAMTMAAVVLAAQAVWVLSPAALIVQAWHTKYDENIAWSIADENVLAVTAWILVPTIVGMITGVIVLGHRTTATVGTEVSDIGPVQAFAVNAGGLMTTILCRLFGLPGFGAIMTVGSITAVARIRGAGRVQLPPLITTIGALALAPLAAGLLSIIFFGLFQLVGDT